MNLEVNFYDEVEDEKLKFAVILSKTQGKWVFCKHKDRNTFRTETDLRIFGSR